VKAVIFLRSPVRHFVRYRLPDAGFPPLAGICFERVDHALRSCYELAEKYLEFLRIMRPQTSDEFAVDRAVCFAALLVEVKFRFHFCFRIAASGNVPSAESC
jgi:hypothetical protein